MYRLVKKKSRKQSTLLLAGVPTDVHIRHHHHSLHNATSSPPIPRAKTITHTTRAQAQNFQLAVLSEHTAQTKSKPSATSRAASLPIGFSTMATANSMAVPGLLLVIRFPSTSTLFSHSLASASRPAMDASVVAFFPCGRAAIQDAVQVRRQTEIIDRSLSGVH